MDGIIILAFLAVLAIPVSIIALFVMVSGLNKRIAYLEAQVSKAPAVQAQTVAEKPAALPVEPPTVPPTAPPPVPEDKILAVSPWDRAVAATKTPVAPPAPATVRVAAEQNRPLVMRSDRVSDLARWVQSNWVYVVSAASLGLAGIFFVQYGMERGLLPPGLRVLFALIFGAGLVGAGEWLRRRHGDEGATPTINLPSVFSGAGIVTLFAAVLAARQLYGLIGPGVAFAGHLATAALAVGLGWLSGPLLVAVGLIGATLAPFIVGGNSTSIDWLYGYFALVAAVGLGVDAVRRWAWVSVLALVLAYGGGFMVQMGGGNDAGWIGLMLALAILAVILPELRLIPTHAAPATLPALAMKGQAGWSPFPVRLALGATLASTFGLFAATSGQSDTAILAIAGLAGLALAFLLWAEKAAGLDDLALPPTLGLLAAIATAPSNWSPLYATFEAASLAQRPPETAPSMLATILLAMATLVTLGYAYRALRPGPWGVPYALAAILTAPLAAVSLELFWNPVAVLGPYPWALHVVALAALMTGLAAKFARTDAGQMRRAAYATLSALSLIALALFILTTSTALTLALAVLVVVAAALDRKFNLPEMGLFLQIGAAVLGYRLLADPGLDWALDAQLSQVLLAFGGTIAAMLVSLYLIRPLSRPMARAVAESAAAGLTAILANVLITRWLDSPQPTTLATEPFHPGYLESHWGITLNSLPWLIFALMQLWRAQIASPLQKLRKGLAVVGGLIAGLGLASAATVGNPLFSWGRDQLEALVRGPMVLDSLFLAYAVPALLLLGAGWKFPQMGQRLRLLLVAAGSALLALYAGLEIRRFWQGDWLGAPDVEQGELYTYTLAMMILGAALLYQAIARRSDGLRRLAMAVIGLTVAKVFLLDASGLTGLTRVVSFAGLGLSLAGLAWLNRWAGSRADDAP